jgi:hypothetical protein
MDVIASGAAAPTPGATGVPSALPAQALEERALDGSDITIAELVGRVYEAAPAPERSRLLEQLLRPLSVLSLVAVAGGVFASLRFRSGWQDFHVRIEDTHSVHAVDVIALVDFVQQVSTEAVDGLVQTLGASSWVTGSAAAALLVTMPLKRARARRGRDVSEAPGNAAGH